jgi:hypothetical protein
MKQFKPVPSNKIAEAILSYKQDRLWDELLIAEAKRLSKPDTRPLSARIFYHWRESNLNTARLAEHWGITKSTARRIVNHYKGI